MTPARCGGRRRRGERGLTLLELLVTITLMGVGFLSLLAAFSTVEVTVGATGEDAQLTSQARAVGDFVRSENFPYIVCGVASGYGTALRAAGYSATIVAVAQAASSTSLPPINGCSLGPATGPDYGVQQIEYRVASAHHSLTRVVYKRWN
ncbi:MAG: type IV pilus modification PilV family protein [Candidatus Dormibacteria bacterium]